MVLIVLVETQVESEVKVLGLESVCGSDVKVVVASKVEVEIKVAVCERNVASSGDMQTGGVEVRDTEIPERSRREEAGRQMRCQATS